ncbi:hypothetical protein [Comamonas sp. GB3 AK4-5]|uniref:hypothetical protein n=1 Tax=Comamonas sp. GB3 AK4-5 TaxID=3231487 RepID=UPI00351E52C7
MSETDTNTTRQQRLEELAEAVGGKAPLGRMLGYRDGAFVSQMISGLRPITEKTVAACEALPGYAGWFSRHEKNQSLSPELLSFLSKQDTNEIKRVENTIRTMLGLPLLK